MVINAQTRQGIVSHRLQVGILGTNCYLVVDGSTMAGYIIDPAAEARRIKGKVESMGMEVEGVLLTHGHWDHVGAAARVAKYFDVTTYIHADDAAILGKGGGSPSVRLSGFITSKPERVELIEEGNTFPLGSSEILILHTPGHTPGSVSYLCDGMLFCGDLIFQGSIGRTDLAGGSMQELIESVREKVWRLPDETIISPGHGPETTLGRERRENPFLAGL